MHVTNPISKLLDEIKQNTQPADLSYSVSDATDLPREIHIWEFPEEFFVKLKPHVIEELVNRAAEHVGGIEQLAHLLNTRSIYHYKTSRVFIPLPTLLQLCEIAGAGFSIEQVEPHIIGYKGGASFKSLIQNPNLPIRESPALFALMGHLMGDGGYNRYEAYYNNTQKALIDGFTTFLRTVFGVVHHRVVATRRKARNQDDLAVYFGKTIVYLLRHIYQTDFRTHTAKVPQRLFELPREYAGAFLRAFGDDEGHVDDAWIRLHSVNQELMQGIYALIHEKFPEMRKFMALRVRKRKKPRWPMYFINFRSGAFECYKAFIGFNHPEKMQALEYKLTRQARGKMPRPRGATRRMLLERLKVGPMTVKELARTLDVSTATIQHHLEDLLAAGFVQVREKKPEAGRGRIFELTEPGRKILSLPSIAPLSGCYGQSRVKLLKLLVGGGMTVRQLVQEFGWTKAAVRHHLTGMNDRGKRRPGLLELGLVERFGRVEKRDPYVYQLTDEGRRVVETLENLFSDPLRTK